MTVQGWLRTAVAAGVLSMAGMAAAQQGVSPSDIERLQDQVFQAGSEVARLRSTDASRASRIETELDELRDEVVYLKVKLRKEGSVNRSEYADLRDRVQDLRTRARGESRYDQGAAPAASPAAAPGAPSSTRPPTPAAQAPAEPAPRPAEQSSGRSAIPVGQEIDVRLQRRLSSDDAQVEDRFEATTLIDLSRGDRVLIPAGSVMRGVVSSVNRASRTDRKGALTLAFDQVVVGGQTYPLRGTVTQAIESEGLRGEAGRIGAGSAVGAVIGGIVGGVRGALIGIAVGGGGTILATEGSDVTLPAGTVLRVRFDTPPEIR
jgi:hypothetical protein